MLEVGTDSYITVDEAKELLEGDKLYDRFAVLSEAEQEYLLKRAAERIDLLPLSGRKKSVLQYMAFPRAGQSDVPYQVKSAQAAEAVCALDTEAESRRTLQAQGVKAVTLGQVSKSYSDNSGSGQSFCGLHSERAFSLLRRYIAGSFPII